MPRRPNPEAWENPATAMVPGADLERRLESADWSRVYVEEGPGGRRFRLGAGPDPAPTAALEPEEAARLAVWMVRRLVPDDAGEAAAAVDTLRRYFDSHLSADRRFRVDATG